MKQKVEYTIVGCTFSLLNCYMTLNGNPLVGLYFGFVAAFFMIKALRVK